MIVCINCKAQNRDTARFCRQCGAWLTQAAAVGTAPTGEHRLEPGLVLAGRYQIIDRGMECKFGHQRVWEVKSFEARDLRTGAKCWVVPIGDDPVEDQLMRRLASLQHRALPRMEIVTYRGMTCFVTHAIEGTLLDSAIIQSPSQSISIGLQLCDLLDATGSRGAGFSWVDLRAPHVLLDSQGQIIIDSFRYCYDWLYERRLAASDDHDAKERMIPPYLSISGYLKLGGGKLLQEDLEAAEVELVGNAMAFPLVGNLAHDCSFSSFPPNPLALRENVCGMLPYLEQAILGAMPSGFLQIPWIRSLAQLRQHLLGQAEGPAHATVSTQRIKFGKVPWGKSLTYSIQLSSLSPGLLYGEIRCKQAGLHIIQPSAFAKAHPARIEITIYWDTSDLEMCGALDGEVLITTGVDSFRIAVHANVRPNAEFHRTQARRHLGRREWALAVQHCDKLIALQPADFGGYWLRGQAYHGLAQYANAATDYTKAIRINPDDAEIWNHRGSAHMRLKQHGLAVRDYSEAIELAPKEPMYYWNRSIAYEAQGRKLDAINDLEQYVALGGRNTQDAQQRIADLQ